MPAFPAKLFSRFEEDVRPTAPDVLSDNDAPALRVLRLLWFSFFPSSGLVP